MAEIVAHTTRNEELAHALEVLPEGVAAELERARFIMDLARDHTFMQSCIVLARGLLYPVALEAALKMTETTYTNARGFAASDFQHGPLALVQHNTPLFLYCSGTSSRQNTVDTAAQYKELGAHVTMVTSEDSPGKDVDNFIPANRSSIYTEAMHHTVIAQLFACGLAQAKRRNPDAPRNLRKITVTK